VVSPHGMRDVRARAIPNGVHLTIAGHGDRRVGDLIRRLKHEGCGGKPKLVELITGIPGSSAWQRRIVLVSPSD
jgi:hypothetical protein